MDFLNFQRPQRYIGNELNVVKKKHSGKISFCLSYPNLYEIGMDNLGLRIIYGLLNSFPDIVCERVFLPGKDLLSFLRKKKIALFSLETKTALFEFDLIGFNLGCELNYLNFLEILDAGGIPLESHKREKTIVIAGGIANPQPLAQFVDVFCLGEFEAVAENLVKSLRSKKNKVDRLKDLSRIEGFYVPGFYQNIPLENSYKFVKKEPLALFPLKRAKVKDLDKSFFPIRWLTPHTKLIQDKVSIEIARGCPNNCNFCQAKNIYQPYREKKIETIYQIIKSVYKNSGYESFSFLSLSVSNHSSIEGLLELVIPFFQKNRIGLNLPSLKIGASLVSIYKKLLPFQKTPLTVALEAGSERLRSKLNKNIQIESLLNCSGVLYRLGLRSIKVYFMYGLPEEDESDLAAIGLLIKRLLRETPFNINISINLFIPKPGSCWEGASLCNINQARVKKEIILKNTPKSRRLKINFSNLEANLIEAVLSRADSGVGSVLLNLFQRKKYFSQDNELLSWPLWEEAFTTENIDWQRYVKVETENFPWSFIES